MQQGDRKEILIDQIVHNWQRSNLRPWETADALARLRDDFQLSQRELCEVTGKPKSEISKLLALHDKVTPEVQTLARNDTGSPLTKRHLYNISKLPAEQQLPMAERIHSESLNALGTEQLIDSISPKAKASSAKAIKKSTGISARQRRFKTKSADVVMTFRHAKVTSDDVLAVINELQQALGHAI